MRNRALTRPPKLRSQDVIAHAEPGLRTLLRELSEFHGHAATLQDERNRRINVQMDWGRRVLRSEALCVWLPCALVGGLGFLIRREPKANKDAPDRTAANAATSDAPGV